MKGSLPGSWRLLPQRLRMEGSNCPDCGTIHFPPKEFCPDCAMGKREPKEDCPPPIGKERER